jgi:hypothetical protein
MRALLTTATAALTLCVLAGCGDASTPAASDQTTTTTTSSTSAAPPSKTPPETPTPSDVATPEPPAGKPQNPTSGEPLLTIEGGKVVVPKGVTELPASQVDASALPQYGGDYSGKAWLHEDGFTVETIAYASSGCTSAEAVVVDQTPGAVKIILRPLDQPLGGKPDDSICATVMTPRPVAVTLDQPLADRKVMLSAGR